MTYSILGRTGLRVSALGFGASALGGEIDPREGERAVRRAIELGITFFDVAPCCGRTLAEERLGNFLAGARDRVVLATKVGRYDIRDFDFSAKRVVRSIDESLLRLRTDHIDVIQAQDVEFTQFEEIVNITLPALERLKERGKVRFIGVTGYPLGMLERILEATAVDTVLSYCRYDLLDTTLAARLGPLATRQGVGLISASPFHMRALTDEGAPARHPLPKRVRDAASRAAVLCRTRGASLAQLALRFALSNTPAEVTLVGMQSTREVDENVGALERPIDRGLLEQVVRIVAPVRNLPWKSGLSENSDPGAVEPGS